eukprot:scaffold29342_cov72-Skeletonema_dohrnii-CCMP3373.AAC.3
MLSRECYCSRECQVAAWPVRDRYSCAASKTTDKPPWIASKKRLWDEDEDEDGRFLAIGGAYYLYS